MLDEFLKGMSGSITRKKKKKLYLPKKDSESASSPELEECTVQILFTLSGPLLGKFVN